MRSLVFPRSVLAFAEAREQAAPQIPDALSQSKPLATIYLWISLGDHFLAESEPGKKPKKLSIHSGVNSDDRVWSWLPLVLCGGTRGPRMTLALASFDGSLTLLDFASGPGSSSEASKAQPALLSSRTSAAHCLTVLVVSMCSQIISCCSLKNIGTKWVLKNCWTVPIRNDNGSQSQPASTVHYCTLSRIMLFLRYCVFPRSDALGQNSSLQQKSALGKSRVRREIVS